MPENNAKTSVKTGPNRQMLRRTLFLMAVCGIAAFLILLGRLYKLQIADHEYYEKLAISQQLREAPTAAARGKIYDTNMNILAVSATVDNVYVSPAEIEMYRARTGRLSRRGLQIYSVWIIMTCTKRPGRPAHGM